MAQGRARWQHVRARVTELLTDQANRSRVEPALHPIEQVQLLLPFEVADYVDFYASEHHAANIGRMFRPDSPPLMPNWKHLPVGYHGRAGTVIASGEPIARPCGQRKPPQADAPHVRPVTTPRYRSRGRLRRRNRQHPGKARVDRRVRRVRVRRVPG